MEIIMQKINVPEDIQRYVGKQIIKKVLVSVVIYAAVLFTLVHYAAKCWESIGAWTVIVYAAIAVLVVYQTHKRFGITDTDWCGEIVDVQVITTMEPRASGASRTAYYYKNTVILDILTDDGEKKKWTVFGKETKHGAEMHFYLEQYKIGSRVMHIRETKFLQFSPESDDDSVCCFVCGYDNKLGIDKCEMCHHSLKISKDQ